MVEKHCSFKIAGLSHVASHLLENDIMSICSFAYCA